MVLTGNISRQYARHKGKNDFNIRQQDTKYFNAQRINSFFSIDFIFFSTQKGGHDRVGCITDSSCEGSIWC